MNNATLLIPKKSIKSHVDDNGDRVYDLPIIYFADPKRDPKEWDPYLSRQKVNYVKGKTIYKLTQPYSKRQYTNIKKRSVTVFDTEGREYYMFNARVFPLYRKVKNIKMKNKLIQKDMDKGKIPSNYLFPDEYNEQVYKKGFVSDAPMLVSIHDFQYESYPDNYPCVYVGMKKLKGGIPMTSYVKLPRETKITVDEFIKHNKENRDSADKYYVFDYARKSYIPDIDQHTSEITLPKFLKNEPLMIPQAITDLMNSIMPKHLEYIEECRAKNDPKYVPKKIHTMDTIMDEPEKVVNDSDFPDISTDIPFY